ncbi:MAG: cell division protein FtsL [Hyphomicrobiaceae bacterium]
MRIAATLAAAAMTLGTAYVLYAESVETRRLEHKVGKQQQQRNRLEAEIAELKSKRARLSRPARIEPAARAIGMKPTLAGDSVRLSDLYPEQSDRPPAVR